MNVLSLFDGISCGQYALKKAGIIVNKYYASEIDQRAIKVATKNFPKTIHYGNVQRIKKEHFLSAIDLLMGGSPCQGFSFAGKRLNFDDPRSKLFFEFVRLKNELNPKYFFLENVKMDTKCRDVITEILNVEPILLDSRFFSSQKRVRLYWTNIPGFIYPKIECENNIENITGIKTGENKPKFELDYKEFNRFTKRMVGLTYHKNGDIRPYKEKKEGIAELTLVCHSNNKSNTLIKSHTPKFYTINPFKIHQFTPLHCERLQGLPDNYTMGISDCARYESLGNGWQVDTIVEFFKNIPH